MKNINLNEVKKISDKVRVAKVTIEDIKIPNFYVAEVTEKAEDLKFKKPYSSYKDGTGCVKYGNPIWPEDVATCRQQIWDNIQNNTDVRKTNQGGLYVDVTGNFKIDLMVTNDNKIIWPNKIEDDDKTRYLIPIKKEEREEIDAEVLRLITEQELIA